MTNSNIIVIYILAGISIGFILASIVFFKFILPKYNKDELTGLLNYSAFKKTIISKTKLESTSSLIVIDIDNFKQYNENSYIIGDNAIIFFTSCLKKVINDKYICGRYRIGDEFGIIIPSNSRLEMFDLIQKLRMTIQTESKIFDNSIFAKMKFSYGYANLNLKSTKQINYLIEKKLKENKNSKSFVIRKSICDWEPEYSIS